MKKGNILFLLFIFAIVFIETIEFTPTNEPKELELARLDSNKYYYMEEIAALVGYKFNDEKYEFEVLESGDIKLLSNETNNIKAENNKIIIYNTIIDVPNTGKTSFILSALSCILLLFGTSIVYFVIRERQLSN